VSFPDLLRLAQDLIRLFPPTHILVEEAANGTALYQELVQAHRLLGPFRLPIVRTKARPPTSAIIYVFQELNAAVLFPGSQELWRILG
jgi:hypothetical protein